MTLYTPDPTGTMQSIHEAKEYLINHLQPNICAQEASMNTSYTLPVKIALRYMFA